MAHAGLIILTMLMALAGCASSAPPPAETPDDTPAFADEYIVGIGDNLSINVYRNPELSVDVTVRPDGMITVPIAGDVLVGGLSPQQVSAELTTQFAEYVRDPIVTTTVNSLGESEYISRIRVTGAVGSPSSIPFRNGMTVLDVVLDAGGVADFANPSKTMIYRADGQRLPVRLDRILNTGDMTTNYTLRPGDIITVPESLF